MVAEKKEDEFYNPIVIEFAAKNLALTLIPPGADYWSNRMITVTSTGTNESKTFPDRIASLWRIHAQIINDIRAMLPQVQQYLPGAGLRNVSSVATNSGRDRPYLSVDPRLWPMEQRLPLGINATSWIGNLPWSEWK